MAGPNDSSTDSTNNNKTKVVDFDDPLYIHPSDNTVTTVINIKLSGTENYRI